MARAARINVFLSVSNNDPEREMEVIETFHRRRVDGVISAAAQISGPYTQRLAQIKMPTILINQQAETEAEQLHSVEVNDYAGARQAVEHLLALGHRTVGYLGAGNRPRSNRRRISGYRDALTAAGIAGNEAWIKVAPPDHRYHTDDVEDGQTLLPELLSSGVTAVFCYNDMIAVGALLACRDLGVAVPEQLSVIGFDDIEIARYVTPPLTTIINPSCAWASWRWKCCWISWKNIPFKTTSYPLNWSNEPAHVLLEARNSTTAADAPDPVTDFATQRELTHKNSDLTDRTTRDILFLFVHTFADTVVLEE